MRFGEAVAAATSRSFEPCNARHLVVREFDNYSDLASFDFHDGHR